MAIHRWTRLSSRRWEDVWVERLQFVGPERIALSTWPDSKALKVEVFCDRRTGGRLVKRFGGKVVELPASAMTGLAQKPRPPLAIRGKLRIFSEEAAWRASPFGGAVFIPAGMAFGTGDHATTATCLRLLCDVRPSLPEGWRAMDVGTGSGILAIAAEKLGAAGVEAFDDDPACVRIAKANARANGCRKTRIIRGDVHRLGVFARCDVILANLFSELLIEAAAGFSKKLRPGGRLIFSGVLRSQYSGVKAGLEEAGFKILRIVARGKWCAGLARDDGNA